MLRDDSRAELLALAALYQVTEAAHVAPIVPTLWLRALLAFLYLQRTEGGRAPYRDFWTTVTDASGGDAPAVGYCRSTYGRTHWNNIVRSLGYEPQSPMLHDAIRALIDRQRRVVDPEWRALQEAAAAVGRAKYHREIVSTKGHPHSEAGRAVMAEEIADGLEPDGTPIIRGIVDAFAGAGASDTRVVVRTRTHIGRLPRGTRRGRSRDRRRHVSSGQDTSAARQPIRDVGPLDHQRLLIRWRTREREKGGSP